MENKKVPVLITREPGGTAIGDKIRDVLLDPEHNKMFGKTEVLLYAAARAQLVDEVIRPALEAGKVVICDRYLDSSIAYQSFGLGEDPDFIRRVNEEATGELYPDLTLVLDVESETGMARLKERLSQENTGEDRIEEKDLEYHERVRQGYLFIARLQGDRIKTIKADGDEEAVHQEIIIEAEKLLLQKE